MNTLSNVFHHIPHTIIEQALMEHNLTIISLITFVKAVDEELAAFKTLKTFNEEWCSICESRDYPTAKCTEGKNINTRTTPTTELAKTEENTVETVMDEINDKTEINGEKI
ncbi:hypothetical protein PGB90_008474 [Kerria lacca]